MDIKNELMKALAYNPDTGIVFWVNRPRITTSNGQEAGYRRKDGYRQICFNQKKYLAHRIAWLLHHGSWPTGDVDHIDGNPSNNKLSNLRDVTHSVNLQNRKGAQSQNKAGLLGVAKRKTHYTAQIHRNGRQVYLGAFTTAELAHQAYKQFAHGIKENA